jgi:hypothetical protein
MGETSLYLLPEPPSGDASYGKPGSIGGRQSEPWEEAVESWNPQGREMGGFSQWAEREHAKWAGSAEVSEAWSDRRRLRRKEWPV